MLLYNRLIELYKNDLSLLSKILLMFHDIKNNYTIFNKSPDKKLKFLNQKGGEIKIFTNNNIKYKYNVEYAKPINKKYSYNQVQLLTINDGTYGCGLMIIDKIRNEANIQSVSDYSDCIICENNEVKYKVGAIIVQILIYECTKLKNKKLTLEDNSKKNFTGSSIELFYYRTMTQGTPYYTKFGFKSITPLIITENKINYEKKHKIKKNKLIEILNNNINNDEKKLVELLKKILNTFNNNELEISNFLIFIFNKAIEKEKQITDKRNNGEHINFINSYAKILNLIIKELFIKYNYKLLPDNKFVLFL
jgi:hypothetical protein